LADVKNDKKQSSYTKQLIETVTTHPGDKPSSSQMGIENNDF